MAEQPEVLPPGTRLGRRRAEGNEQLTDEQLNQLATVLDDVFQIPGTNFRFGLDAIVGIIPGIGDLLTSAVSMLMIYAAWQRGLSRVTMARMVANVAIDSIVGAMPLVGDIFDAAWKANRRNYQLLQRAKQEQRRMHTAVDWLFLLLAFLCIALVVLIPLAVLWWLIKQI